MVSAPLPQPLLTRAPREAAAAPRPWGAHLQGGTPWPHGVSGDIKVDPGVKVLRADRPSTAGVPTLKITRVLVIITSPSLFGPLPADKGPPSPGKEVCFPLWPDFHSHQGQAPLVCLKALTPLLGLQLLARLQSQKNTQPRRTPRGTESTETLPAPVSHGADPGRNQP